MLAAALEANQEMARLSAELREENARPRAENAEQAAEPENLRAGLVVFQRMLLITHYFHYGVYDAMVVVGHRKLAVLGKAIKQVLVIGESIRNQIPALSGRCAPH